MPNNSPEVNAPEMKSAEETGLPPLSDQVPEIGATRDQLLAASKDGPVLLLFLRHFGCTFCREALADLRKARRSLADQGVRVAVVHMSSREAGHEYQEKYHLADAVFISDPHKKLYRAFNLRRGKPAQLFGPKVWLRGAKAGLFDGHGIGWLEGDGLQMPGTFVLNDGQVVWEYRHESAADRPDYLAACSGGACSLEAAPPQQSA
jgi:hypothetical protein